MSTPTESRADRHNNPTAMTTDVAKEGGLTYGTPDADYTIGDPFTVNGHTYYTARLLGSALVLTIDVIDKIGFRTASDIQRWEYISLPHFDWLRRTTAEKIDIIGAMYKKEGGTTMRRLFPNYNSFTWL